MNKKVKPNRSYIFGFRTDPALKERFKQKVKKLGKKTQDVLTEMIKDFLKD